MSDYAGDRKSFDELFEEAYPTHDNADETDNAEDWDQLLDELIEVASLTHGSTDETNGAEDRDPRSGDLPEEVHPGLDDGMDALAAEWDLSYFSEAFLTEVRRVAALSDEEIANEAIAKLHEGHTDEEFVALTQDPNYDPDERFVWREGDISVWRDGKIILPSIGDMLQFLRNRTRRDAPAPPETKLPEP